ncbi:MAG: hypothetical protein AB7F88_19825 [Pyrinomonadaceae bacterium]
MKRVFLLAILLLFTSSGSLLIAQRRSSVNAPNRNVPFDKSITKLPIGFTGIDGDFLFRELEKRKKSLVKLEFETTAQFAARVQHIENSPITPFLNKDSLMAFVVAPSGFSSSYDADRSILVFSILLSGACSRFPLTEKIVVSKYKSQNAFGAEREVTKYEGTTLSIGWGYDQKLKTTPFLGGKELIGLTAKLEPSVAAVLKPKLRVLVIGKLKKRMIDQCREVVAPTFQVPKELDLTHQLISFVVDEIWLFDPASGTVYDRIVE